MGSGSRTYLVRKMTDGMQSVFIKRTNPRNVRHGPDLKYIKNKMKVNSMRDGQRRQYDATASVN